MDSASESNGEKTTYLFTSWAVCSNISCVLIRTHLANLLLNGHCWNSSAQYHGSTMQTIHSKKSKTVSECSHCSLKQTVLNLWRHQPRVQKKYNYGEKRSAARVARASMQRRRCRCAAFQILPQQAGIGSARIVDDEKCRFWYLRIWLWWNSCFSSSAVLTSRVSDKPGDSFNLHWNLL